MLERDRGSNMFLEVATLWFDEGEEDRCAGRPRTVRSRSRIQARNPG